MVAAPNYLVDGLVTFVRNDYISPTSQNLFQDTDVVSQLDEALRSEVVPFVNSIREEYFIQVFDQAITGAASYTIPQRAAAAILRDVVFVDASGNEIELTYLSPVQIKSSFPFGLQLPLYTFGYYVQDDQIYLYPQQARQATGYTLRMKFMRMPNTLTLSSNCGQITNIASNIVTVGNLPSDWTTNTTFDIIQNFPQFKSISDGQAITNINSGASQITLSSVPTGLAIGMWLCPTLTSCIPQIPYMLFGLLIAYGAQYMSRSIGDSQGQQSADKKVLTLEDKARRMMTPRVQGGAKKIINRNQPANWGQMGAPFQR